MGSIMPANVIKRLREQRHLAQGELAEKLKISVEAVKDWENGISEPTLSEVERLATALNVDVMKFYDYGLEGWTPEWRFEETTEREKELRDSEEYAANGVALAEAWLKEHSEHPFRPGFNHFSLCLMDDSALSNEDIRSIYGKEFFDYCHVSIRDVGVIVKRLKTKGYLLTSHEVDIEKYARFGVYLRDEEEADAFTRDLAMAIARPVVTMNDADEYNTQLDFREIITGANVKLNELVARTIYGVRFMRYHVSVFEGDAVRGFFDAKDDRDLVEKIEVIKPEKYIIDALSYEDTLRLYEKIKQRLGL